MTALAIMHRLRHRVEPPAAAEPEQLRLFSDGGVDLQALRMERAALAQRTRSGSTRRAYASCWADFERWCTVAGRNTLPASADTLSLYIVDLARRKLSVATIEQRKSAIAEKHLSSGMDLPVNEAVREVMRAVRRRLGAAPKHAKAALSVSDLRAMLRTCGSHSRGIRDRAILLLGFAAGLRRSEISALDVGDVELVSAGVIVQIRRSKTDQLGRGREIGVHCGRCEETCPARAVARWIQERGGWPGPLFVQTQAHLGALTRQRLGVRTISILVKEHAAAASLAAEKYSGHSLRAGMATAASANGADALAIMGRSGHRSVAMVQR